MNLQTLETSIYLSYVHLFFLQVIKPMSYVNRTLVWSQLQMLNQSSRFAYSCPVLSIRIQTAGFSCPSTKWPCLREVVSNYNFETLPRGKFMRFLNAGYYLRETITYSEGIFRSLLKNSYLNWSENQIAEPSTLGTKRVSYRPDQKPGELSEIKLGWPFENFWLWLMKRLSDPWVSWMILCLITWITADPTREGSARVWNLMSELKLWVANHESRLDRTYQLLISRASLNS